MCGCAFTEDFKFVFSKLIIGCLKNIALFSYNLKNLNQIMGLQEQMSYADKDIIYLCNLPVEKN